MGSRGFIYVTVGPVTNPGETDPTSSFTYEIQDPTGSPVEGCTEGIYFTATAGGFSQLSVKANTSLINERQVDYTFTMRPQDVFTSDAVLKITLPTQLYVSAESYVIDGTEGVVQKGLQTQVDVLFNRIIYIYGAFPNGLPAVEAFSITLSDFVNPSTTQETDSFEFKIFYEEDVNEVSVYKGTQVTFTASPSQAISLDVPQTDSYLTGDPVTLTFTATMERESSIEKQSSLQVAIPSSYVISNYDRAASTCTTVDGFSDEIICDFEEFVQGSSYHLLNVRGGFDSQTFEARTTLSFSFTLSEINNPLTTKVPLGFGIEVYDKYGGKMYEAPEKTFPMGMKTSDFAFAYIDHYTLEESVTS